MRKPIPIGIREGNLSGGFCRGRVSCAVAYVELIFTCCGGSGDFQSSVKRGITGDDITHTD